MSQKNFEAPRPHIVKAGQVTHHRLSYKPRGNFLARRADRISGTNHKREGLT
jgi:hypothetical protein